MKKQRKKSSKIGKALAMIGLGALTVFQPETAIVTIPLILGIGKGK